MTQTSTVAVCIKKEIKETLERAGVNILEAVKNHLEELYWKIRLKEETEALRKILEKVKPSERGFAEKSVREDRESH
ncbi:MAG: VapB-type antitoxin [Candidatus Bathyarchaeia archaeon]